MTDVKQKTLWVNEETGATWALIKFPPGIADKKHIHPEANQLVYAISGAQAGKGVMVVKKGEPHGRSDVSEETILLFYWDGPPDPEVIE